MRSKSKLAKIFPDLGIYLLSLCLRAICKLSCGIWSECLEYSVIRPVTSLRGPPAGEDHLGLISSTEIAEWEIFGQAVLYNKHFHYVPLLGLLSEFSFFIFALPNFTES